MKILLIALLLFGSVDSYSPTPHKPRVCQTCQQAGHRQYYWYKNGKKTGRSFWTPCWACDGKGYYYNIDPQEVSSVND